MDPKLHASVFAPQRRVGLRRANREKRRRRCACKSFSPERATIPSSTIRLLEHPHKRSMSQIRAPRSGARAEARRQSKPSNRHTRIETLERPADDALFRKVQKSLPILPSVPKRDAPVRPIRHVEMFFSLLVHEPDRAPHAPAPTRQRGVGVSSRRCNKQQTCLVGRDVLRQN